MIDGTLAREIFNSLSPDGWNNRWSQVNRFGGGNAVECEVGELLHAIVRAIKPNVTIETGTHKGFSTLMVASAIKRNGFGHLYTVDVHDHGVNEELKKFALKDQASFIQGDSAQVIPEILRRTGTVDFLWLDADHSTEAVVRELNLGKPGLRPGSYVAFHDTISDPRERVGVTKILQENQTWEHIHFMTARGFDLIRVK